MAARENYIGQDGMDMQFAAQEISRFMTKSEEQDWRSAKRLARYLKDNKRMVIEHKANKLPEKVVAWWMRTLRGASIQEGQRREE